MTSFSGIFPALITPFDSSERIDEKALRRLISFLVDSGVNGFYACGTTAETFLLSIEERKRLLETAVDEAKGRVPVICHIGAISTAQAVDLGRHAAKAGASAVSAIPPFYYKFTLDELKSHYLEILREVDLPLIPYNFPNLSGVTLGIDNFGEVLRNEKVIGVKHTSSDFFQLDRMKNIGKKLVVFNGFDEMFLSGLAMGADGAIGSTFNFMPERFLAIKKLFDENRIKEARAVQSEANEIIKVVLDSGSLAAHKYLLTLRGIDCGICRKPFKPLGEEAKGKLRDIHAKFFSSYPAIRP